MPHDSEHDALAVLREIYDQVKPNAPWELIRSAYMIEREYQFESDRDVAVADLRNLVIQHVTDELNSRGVLGEGNVQ